jgi:hypothetical protein
LVYGHHHWDNNRKMQDRRIVTIPPARSRRLS